MKATWLVKTEPGNFSWEDLCSRPSEPWDGVRNYQARNNLAEMARGDLVLVYHSVKEKRVMGVAKVVKKAYQDPTTEDERWVCVDLKALKELPAKVTLAEIKADPDLADILLVRHTRLSVMPIPAEAFDRICQMGGLKKVPA